MSVELPLGWALTTLEQVVEDISYGFTASASTAPVGPQFLRITDLQNGSVQWESVPYCKIPTSKIAHYSLRSGDIVFARTGATTGKSFLITSCPPAVFASYLIRVRLSTDILPEFVAFFFQSQSYWNQVNENISGSAQPSCNASKLKTLNLPIAPLNEQRRIVAKLEKLLDKVDACQKRLTKIPILLKRFRQSVLAAACSGRLTEDWREQNPDVESAIELFEKIQVERKQRYENDCREAMLNGRRKPKHPSSNKQSRSSVGALPELPDTWAYFRIDELCHLITDGTHKTPEYVSEGVMFLSVKNVRPFRVLTTDIKFISTAEHLAINTRCNPEKGDILYTKIGATFGYAAINELDYPFSIFVSLALLKPAVPFFQSAYAEILMNSEIIFHQARERVSGIGTPDLHLIEIRDFRGPLPPLAEQEEIVRRVGELFALADQVEARYAKAKQHVDGLEQSLLTKAFRGELVPQDSNDESASILLERIRQVRANRQPDRSRQRVKKSDPEHRRFVGQYERRIGGSHDEIHRAGL